MCDPRRTYGHQITSSDGNINLACCVTTVQSTLSSTSRSLPSTREVNHLAWTIALYTIYSIKGAWIVFPQGLAAVTYASIHPIFCGVSSVYHPVWVVPNLAIYSTSWLDSLTMGYNNSRAYTSAVLYRLPVLLPVVCPKFEVYHSRTLQCYEPLTVIGDI